MDVAASPAAGHANARRLGRSSLLLLTLLAFLCLLVFLNARFGPVLSPTRSAEREGILTFVVTLLAWPNVAGVILVTAILRIRGHRNALVPLLLALLAVSVPLWPLGHFMRDVDEHLHAGARAEIVRRLETGELQAFGGHNGQGGRFTPSWVAPGQVTQNGMAALPNDYPEAVSS